MKSYFIPVLFVVSFCCFSEMYLGVSRSGTKTIAPLAEIDSLWFIDSVAALAAFFPASLEVDSCTRSGAMEFYDTTNMRQKVDGYVAILFPKQWIRCAYQTYVYPNPILTQTQDIIVSIHELVNADSAQSLYASEIEFRDTAQVISTAAYQGLITQGSWNLECVMQKGKYFIKFDGIAYNDSVNAPPIIKGKLVQFCAALNGKIP